jgi:hypothetical protein
MTTRHRPKDAREAVLTRPGATVVEVPSMRVHDRARGRRHVCSGSQNGSATPSLSDQSMNVVKVGVSLH